MFKRFHPLLAPLLLLASLAASAADLRSLPDFSSLVEANGQAVVNISTTQQIKRMQNRQFHNFDMPDTPGGPFGDLLRRYFGEDGMPEMPNSKSLGSGFIISPDGYILTCAHVVDNAKEIIVKLNDRRELTARLIGADKRTDVALLKIDATGLPKVTIGAPERLKVGEWVLAIGSPFGFESTATAGIVSAKGRSLPRENYVPFIQTDVAINPGNSGGPLFNLKGEVVGINSQIYSRTGGFMGLSFAVPIDIAMQVSQQLKTGGKVKRGWLGVSIQDVNRELAESFGMKKPQGALVNDILPDGPSAKSELRSGDIIIEFDGARIENSADLPPVVGRTAPGTRSRLTVLRAGETRTITVTVGELNEERLAEAADERNGPGVRKEHLGLALRDLTAEQRKELNVSGGVLVERVGPGPAGRAGIEPGDVILQMDGKPVKNVASFRELVARAPKSRAFPVLVRRGSGSLFLALRLGE